MSTEALNLMGLFAEAGFWASPVIVIYMPYVVALAAAVHFTTLWLKDTREFWHDLLRVVVLLMAAFIVLILPENPLNLLWVVAACYISRLFDYWEEINPTGFSG